MQGLRAVQRGYGRARQNKARLGKAKAMHSKAKARFGRVCTAAATQADAIRGLAPHGKGTARLNSAGRSKGIATQDSAKHSKGMARRSKVAQRKGMV